jgi:hypothetical protein
MAVSIAKTEYFSSGSISFSQIRDAFGGGASNVKASDYLKNTNDSIDWNGENASNILPRVPDATENDNVSASDDWGVSDLRNTIKEYNVIQNGTDLEVAYDDNDTTTWNGNLSRNILKKFDVTGTIHSDDINNNALEFSGNLYNLEIEVDELGAIYAQGGAKNQDGGDALYVNNSYTKSDVEIRAYGKIWSGGGGGNDGTKGANGPNLNCYTRKNWNYNGSGGNNKNWNGAVSTSGCKNTGNRPGGVTNSSVSLYKVNPNSIRSRCRGGGYRRGQNWRSANWSGYQCSPAWTGYCRGNSPFTVSGGTGGSKGTGGQGKGFANINVPINTGIHVGNSGGNGGTNNCSANGTASTGKKGNPGKSGGDWGEDSANTKGGVAIFKKGAKVNYYTSNTVKGKIRDI